mgnify:CR=1 FL=1
MRRRLIEIVVCPACRAALVFKDERASGEGPEAEIVEGTLRCGGCECEYPIVDGVPWLALSLLRDERNRSIAARRRVASFYGYGWRRSTSNQSVGVGFRSHFDMMNETVAIRFMRGPLALDAGCGGGRDLAVMAERHPEIEFLGVDLSEGVYVARDRTRRCANVHVVRGDLGGLPFRTDTFSSVYSYGVLHHTPDPAASLAELVRVALGDAPVVTYLYEDFSESRTRYVLARVESRVRVALSHLPAPVLFGLSAGLAPAVFALFVIPHRVLTRFRATRRAALAMPFRHAVNVSGLVGDIYDRFVPVLFRFSREQVLELYARAGLRRAEARRMRGWATWGFK